MHTETVWMSAGAAVHGITKCGTRCGRKREEKLMLFPKEETNMFYVYIVCNYKSEQLTVIFMNQKRNRYKQQM